MPPSIPSPDDRVTPFIVKYIVLPLIVVVFLLMAVDDQLNQWKCSREAKRQGYLEGQFYPAFRFSPAQCVCRKQLREDGTIDNYAKKVIDLENNKLKW